MYEIRRFKALLALCAVLGVPMCALGDCTKAPISLGAIAGDFGSSSSDLDLYANFISQCAAFDTTATGRIRLHSQVALTDAWSQSGGANINIFEVAPTITQTATSGGALVGYYYDPLLTSATASVQPGLLTPFYDLGIAECNNVSCGSQGASYGLYEGPTLRAIGASGSMTVSALNQIRLGATISADTAGGSITVTDRRGIYCVTPSLSGAGTKTLTNNTCIDLLDQTTGTNVSGLRSAISAGANKFFLNDTGGAQSALAGKFTTYNGVTTSGYGVPAIVATGRFTGQTAAKASVSTYTVGSSDGTFRVSANVLVTTSTVHSFTATCAYTDEGNTARTITLNFSTLAGVISNAGIANAAGAVPYAGVPLHIRAKSGTAITIATTGTFTTVTYNVEGLIEQLA